MKRLFHDIFKEQKLPHNPMMKLELIEKLILTEYTGNYLIKVKLEENKWVRRTNLNIELKKVAAKLKEDLHRLGITNYIWTLEVNSNLSAITQYPNLNELHYNVLFYAPNSIKIPDALPGATHKERVKYMFKTIPEAYAYKKELQIDTFWYITDNTINRKIIKSYKNICEIIQKEDFTFEWNHLGDTANRIKNNFDIRKVHSYNAIDALVTTIKKEEKDTENLIDKIINVLFVSFKIEVSRFTEPPFYNIFYELLQLPNFKTAYVDNLKEAFLRKIVGRFYNLQIEFTKIKKILNRIILIQLLATYLQKFPEKIYEIREINDYFQKNKNIFIQRITVPIYILLCNFYNNVLSIERNNTTISYRLIDTFKEQQNLHKHLKANFVPSIKFVIPPNWIAKLKNSLKKNYTGGFHLNKFTKLTALTDIHPTSSHRVILEDKKIIKSINRLQSTPYKINWDIVNDFLNQMTLYETTKSYPDNYIESLSLKENLIKIKNTMEILKIRCNNLIDNFPVYFPIGLDHRGRIKPLCYPHYIGPKIIRSFLIAPFKYNLDIKEFIQCMFVRFFKEKQAPELYSQFFSKSNSITNFNSYISQAKEPQMFLPLLKENIKYQEASKDYYSDILIGQDCTSSVLQIQNMLLNNSKFERELNLIYTAETGSIYKRLGEEFTKKIRGLIYTPEINQEYKNLIAIYLSCDFEHVYEVRMTKKKYVGNRIPFYVSSLLALRIFFDELDTRKDAVYLLTKIIKFNVIQSGYGGVHFSLMTRMNDLCNAEDFLCGLIWVRNVFIIRLTKFLLTDTGQLSFLKICKTISHLYCKYNVPIKYISYSGTTNISFYKQFTYKRIFRDIRIVNSKAIFKSSLTVPISSSFRIFTRKHDNALCANLTQMIDASLVHELSSQFVSSRPLMTIHDSFTTITSDMARVQHIVQHFFFRLFTTPTFHSSDSFYFLFSSLLHNLLFYFFTTLISILKKTLKPRHLVKARKYISSTFISLLYNQYYSPMDRTHLLTAKYVAVA